MLLVHHRLVLLARSRRAGVYGVGSLGGMLRIALLGRVLLGILLLLHIRLLLLRIGLTWNDLGILGRG